VAVEVARGAERLAAGRHLACVRARHVVRPHVLGQLDVAHELAGAALDGAVHGLDGAVQPHVPREVARGAEALAAAAGAADVRTLTRVGLHVLRECVLAVEAAPAVRALVGPAAALLGGHVGREHDAIELGVLHVGGGGGRDAAWSVVLGEFGNETESAGGVMRY